MGNVKQQALPDGWRLVPVEPTPEMLNAMQSSKWPPEQYRRMLAAAPQPAEQSSGVAQDAPVLSNADMHSAELRDKFKAAVKKAGIAQYTTGYTAWEGQLETFYRAAFSDGGRTALSRPDDAELLRECLAWFGVEKGHKSMGELYARLRARLGVV